MCPSLPLPVLLFVIPEGNLLLSLPVFARHSGVARISVVVLVLLFVIPEENLLLSFVCHSERSEESPHLSLFRFARHSELRSESPSLPLPVLLFVIPAGNLLLSLPVFARHSGVARISVVRLCFCLILLLS
jgi:hypothetical protein